MARLALCSRRCTRQCLCSQLLVLLPADAAHVLCSAPTYGVFVYLLPSQLRGDAVAALFYWNVVLSHVAVAAELLPAHLQTKKIGEVEAACSSSSSDVLCRQHSKANSTCRQLW
jgi:hypothetical protein